MNKQQLATKVWASVNQMRSKIEANEYKDYILGFIFYKYLSDKEIQFAQKEGSSDEEIKAFTEDNTDTVSYVKQNLGYFIAYENLFSTWIEKGRDFGVSNVRDALSAFNRSIHPKHKKLFENIFHTLETGISKLGSSSASQTKAISGLIHIIKDIPMNGKQDYDVMGFIYEYLISMFAANAGKKAGEFYTPHEVSLLMSEIVAEHLKDKDKIEIYDPTSGSGSLLINIGRSVAKHIEKKSNIKYYAQELKANTYNLTRMNLVMRGILPDNIETRNGDTLENDWPYFDENDPVNSYNPLYVDAVVSNPPYSQKWEAQHKETDPRYARYGLAPKSKADFAFLLHDLYHLKPKGIMTIVLPHGVLFRGGEEGKIRKNLIEFNKIDAIIGLPANIFFGTGIPTVVIVLKQNRQNDDVLIIDASKGFMKIGKNNKLRASDIKKIADTYAQRKSEPKFSKKVERDEIRGNDYNLNIPRYVDSSDNAESWDIYSSMFGGIPVKEIEELDKYWQTFKNLKDDLFRTDENNNTQLKVKDLKKSIQEHNAVKEFVQNFNIAFRDFDEFLKNELLNDTESVSISKEETVLSSNIFNRLENIMLIDKYQAYQLLDDNWEKIAVDLEIIQTEGFAVTKQVDPNMVMKKKKGKDVEVQEGWKGHIMPFELVQETYLQIELESIKTKENRLAEITSELEEILDSLAEDEKDSDLVNEKGDAFVKNAIVKEAKIINVDRTDNFADDSLEMKVVKVNKLFAEDKKLKAKVKEEIDKLHNKTKTTIETLAQEKVYELLELKWISPLVNALYNLPVKIISELSTKVQNLADKYATTYGDVADEIEETETTLANMINELTGNERDMKGLNELMNLLKGE